MEHNTPYHAYLIRLWPTCSAGSAGYRVSLQDVSTGQTVQLPDLEGLHSYLQDTCSSDQHGETGPAHPAEMSPETPGDTSAETAAEAPLDTSSEPTPRESDD